MYLNYNAGMRVSELVSMNIEGVSDQEWGLAVLVRRAKSGPYGEVPVDEAHAPLGVAAARKWIAALREHGVTSGPLFPRIYDGVINPAALPERVAGRAHGRAADRQNHRRRCPRGGPGRQVHGALRAARHHHGGPRSRPWRA